MFHPRIICHYIYRVTECQSHAVDACADVAQYEGISVHALAVFLRSIGAVGANRLNAL